MIFHDTIGGRIRFGGLMKTGPAMLVFSGNNRKRIVGLISTGCDWRFIFDNLRLTWLRPSWSIPVQLVRFPLSSREICGCGIVAQHALALSWSWSIRQHAAALVSPRRLRASLSALPSKRARHALGCDLVNHANEIARSLKLARLPVHRSFENFSSIESWRLGLGGDTF